jgi:predicted nicotinamide N-methyase
VPDVEHYIAVCAAAQLRPVPLVPDITLYTGEDAYAVWEITTLGDDEPPVPYWSFPWAGGQALARYLLDNPSLVSGRRILDLAAGSGLVAIASLRAGAAHAVANDVDPFAAAAQDLNGRANGVQLDIRTEDLLDGDPRDAGVDVVLAGDVCYEQELATRIVDYLRRAAAGGALVLLADPGRTYVPRSGLERVAEYDVPTTLALEGTASKRTTIWRPAIHDA